MESDIPDVLPSVPGLVGSSDAAALALVEDLPTSCLADSTLAHPVPSVPSLQPWQGRHFFNISIPTGNRDRNKWCYSKQLDKLYVCQNIAVPVNVMLKEWINATITITAVYKQSCHRTDPVNRCFMCKSKTTRDPSIKDHVVQVEDDGCEYNIINDRCMVTIPLRAPAPGEGASTLLVKIMCLTSCLGGPNRRPFALVFTLRDGHTKEEIGRQTLDVKCCRCPSRDMTNDEKGMVPAPADEEKTMKTRVRKLAKEIADGQRRKKPRIKLEPGLESRYVNVAVPVEYEAKVKAYVNSLIGADLIKRCYPELALYSEEETS